MRTFFLGRGLARGLSIRKGKGALWGVLKIVKYFYDSFAIVTGSLRGVEEMIAMDILRKLT